MIPDEIFLFNDNTHGLYLGRDHYHGIVVQVARLKAQRIDMQTGEKQIQSQPQVIFGVQVDAYEESISSPLNASLFKGNCIKAVSAATAELTKLRHFDISICALLGEEEKVLPQHHKYKAIIDYDHFAGLVGMIVRTSKKRKLNNDGSILSSLSPQCMWKKTLELSTVSDVQKVAKSLKELSSELSMVFHQFIQIETNIDGVMADYQSQAGK